MTHPSLIDPDLLSGKTLSEQLRRLGLFEWSKVSLVELSRITPIELARFPGSWLFGPRKLTFSGTQTLINGSNDGGCEKRWILSARKMLGAMARTNGWVYMPLELDECKSLFSFERVLVCLGFPQVQLTALSNTSRVLSTHIDVVRVSLAMGVPAVLLVQTKCLKNVESFVPQLVWKGGILENEMAELCQSIDWRAVSRRQIEIKNYYSKIEKTPRAQRKDTIEVCCIASRDYLNRLSGFLENLSQVTSQQLKLYFLGLDEESRDYVKRNYGQFVRKIFSPKDLWTKHELSRLQKRSVAEMAYASKGRLMRASLQAGAKKILYSDLDVFYFRSPNHIFKELKKGTSALLFPHWNQSYVNARQHGIFNAGMLVADVKAIEFLNWWSKLCLSECSESIETGHFVDQAYLDLAHACFPQVNSYRFGDENVAAWNFETLGVVRSKTKVGMMQTRNRMMVGSFHVPTRDTLGLFEIKFAWDQMVRQMMGSKLQVVGGLQNPLSSEDKRQIFQIHARYFPAVERLNHFYEAVGNRINNRLIQFPSGVTQFLSTAGSGLTLLWEPIRGVWNRTRSKSVQMNDRHWIDIQSSALRAQSETIHKGMDRMAHRLRRKKLAHSSSRALPHLANDSRII